MIRRICQVLITVRETPKVTMEPYRETFVKNFCVFFWNVDPREKSGKHSIGKTLYRDGNPIVKWNEKMARKPNAT